MNDNQRNRQRPADSYGWKIAAITLSCAVLVQIGAWVYWFSWWRSLTDKRIADFERHQQRAESKLDALPRRIQIMQHQQQLTIQAINQVLVKNGLSPVVILRPTPLLQDYDDIEKEDEG